MKFLSKTLSHHVKRNLRAPRCHPSALIALVAASLIGGAAHAADIKVVPGMVCQSGTFEGAVSTSTLKLRETSAHTVNCPLVRDVHGSRKLPLLRLYVTGETSYTANCNLVYQTPKGDLGGYHTVGKIQTGATTYEWRNKKILPNGAYGISCDARYGDATYDSIWYKE